MRYLIIIVCIILAGVALMPVFMSMGRKLKVYFDSATKPKTEKIEEETDKVNEEFSKEDK